MLDELYEAISCLFSVVFFTFEYKSISSSDWPNI